ncbi:hypothetical protein LTR36_006873 [Oleoguttula mirabilis]|uniref:Nucleoporin Nup159/Nup146 N-terminal domain-containing protein n=1 Tax=Oleoguttula mirabilis TaxID=1507867 RepID=A0AAV9JBN1_9PEZI|nr:hypothetical protein LTR36_006873 [Oleoguttula mirabilis]
MSLDLEDVTTEQLGFQSVSGEDKLRLLPSPWPTESQPPASASLLSIASGKGLVAAAGPDTLVLAETHKLRQTLKEGEAGSGGVKSFAPAATLQIPRVSQVAFSSDESCLVIVAEQGGGLQVYDVNALTSGKTEPAFQINTDGASVRQLLPNPNPSDSTSHLFGVVLQTGELLLADLKTRELAKSYNGSPIFHESIVCACWSRLGKQIVAGREDGTAVQIDQQGNIKAQIPRPPQLAESVDGRAQAQPLMSIYWIDTNDFLLVHTPVNPTRPPTPEPRYDSSGNPDYPPEPPTDSSVFHLAQRPGPKSNDWTFHKIADPTPAFIQRGRIPAHHFIQRLKDWPPNLDDLLFLLSTVSTDIGMMTKSKTPLDPEKPVTGIFTTTMPEDSRRAGMPMSAADGMSETSAIGMALDLSVKETIRKPIPNDETLDESPVPLPALYVLNNEGMLSVWYIVYNESIRQKIAFPDLIAAGGPRPLEQKKESAVPASASSSNNGPASLFGAMASPKASPAPQQSAFAAPSTPGFGGASALGGKSSLWGNPGAPAASSAPAPASAFAKPTFGSTSTPMGGAGFGQAGGMGMGKPSVWGTPQNQQPPSSPGPKFGQAGAPFGSNASQQSPFASFGKKDSEQKPSSPSLFGNGQPTTSFGGVGAQKENQQSPWAKPAVSNEPSFGSTATLGSGTSGSMFGGSFGTPSHNAASSFSFGKPSLPTSREETMGDEDTPTKPDEQKQGGAGLFGLGGGGGFKLGSTFKGDGSAKDDLPKPKDAGAGFFGGSFGNALGEASEKPSEPVTPIKKEPGTDDGPKLQNIPAFSTKPASPPKQPAPPSLDEVLKQKSKRFFGDIPPMDVPSEAPATTEKAKVDEKAEEAPKPKPRNLFGEISSIPGNVPPTIRTAKENETPEVPLAGSPPIDLGNERFSEVAGSEEELPAGPEDEDESWDEEEDEDEEGEEGDEEDDDDRSEEEEDQELEITDPNALSAFEARVTRASPEPPKPQDESTTPDTAKKPSYTPAGFPKAPVSFAPPSHTHESPRSPSPVRSVPPPFSKPTFGRPSEPMPAQPQRIAVPPGRPVERLPAPSRHREPTEGELQDAEDARVQAVLSSKPELTKEVPPFFAHQNYVGETEKPGIGGQIEKVYRDINGMLDTLGLNARSLQGFVDGHVELKKPGERTREDLEKEEGWTFNEVEQLAIVQADVEERLEDGRLEDVKETLEGLREDDKDVTRSRAKMGEVRKRIRQYTDEEQRAAQSTAPLPVESQTQQSELRQGVQRVQKLLGQVEEAMSMLRADLASAATASSQTNGTAKVPTVEAVTNTILKMTAMVEQRSGDIDVLESQIKRLPHGIASLNLNGDYEDQLVASMTGSNLLKGSPYTPSASRSRMLANGDAPGMSGMLGSRFRTPPSKTGGRRSVMFSPEASRLGMSTGSVNGSASTRKKMTDVTQEEVRSYHVNAGRRRKVLDALRESVRGRGPRIVAMEG